MAKSDVLIRMKADTQNYDANIAKARRQLDQFKKDNLSMGGVMKQLNGTLLATAAQFASVTAAVGALGAAFKSNIETAKNFEKSMSQLSSLTGMVGSDLEKLKGYAIELGSSTTLSASQVADAFKMIGSQQPQLLSSGEALKAVTKNAITLAEAAGIELSDAAKTLSVSINQMGGDSNNAERYINVLAAAAQKGAGDIVWLGEAITKSGTTAKAVGTDYEELVANLEQLAKAGYDASTAGTALRSIIMNLEKQANQQYKPSVVGLTEAFKNLGEANLTLTEYQGIAGKMFAAQAKALADAAAEAKNMKEEITGTNIAEEQAKINTDNLDGALKSLASAWEGLNLHINDSNGFLRTCVDWLKDVVVWADQAFTAAGRAQKKLLEMQGGTGGSPTKVDKQISALGGSNFKQQKFNSQMNKYNQDIKVADYFINQFEKDRSSVNTVLLKASKRFGEKLNSISDLQAIRDAMANMRDEYQSRGQKLIESAMGGGTNNGKGGTTVTFDVDADTEEATKSIQELQNKIKELKKLRDDAANKGDTKLRDQYNAQIKGVQAEIKAMRGGTTTTHTTRDKEAEQTARMLAELRKQEAKATKEIADARAREHRTETTGTSGFNEQNIANWTAMMKDQLSKADFGSVIYDNIEENMRDMTTITDLTKEALKRGLDPQQLGLTELFETAFDNIDVPDSTLKAIVDKINAAIKDGVKLEINDETGSVSEKKPENVKESDGILGDTSKVVSGLSSVASGLQQMGVKLPKGIQEALSVIQGLMSVVQGVNTVLGVINVVTTPAKLASESANTVAESANTIALGVLTAAITANTSALAVNSALSIIPFARGGIIKAAGGTLVGTQYSGDNLRGIGPGGQLYGLNAGEVVLNRAEAGVIAGELEGGNRGGGYTPSHVSGEQIWIALNAYTKRTGKGELVTWR